MDSVRKEKIIIIGSILFSIFMGILSHDTFWGVLALGTSLTSSYYCSVGKKAAYVLGVVNCIVIGIIGLMNHLHGMFVFNVFLFLPLQYVGYKMWTKNQKPNKRVIVREFTLLNSILITLTSVVGSFVVGYLLHLIPGQRLPFMDATSNIINLMAFILLIFRFKECWWLWLANNVVDLIIWITNFINGGASSFMMLLVSIGYLVINIYGVVKWQVEVVKNRGSKYGKKERKN